jgi:hypothetical protein
VRDERAAESEQAETDSADVDGACRGLVEHVQVRDRVRAGAEALEDLHVLARAPEGVDGHGELDLAGEEERELGEHRDGDGLADERGRILGREQVRALWAGDEGRILGEVAEGAVVDAFETGRLWAAADARTRQSARIGRAGRPSSPKKPKSPVWMIALALASRARSLREESLPRMSAMQSSRPWSVSRTWVSVFTLYGAGGGTGDAAGFEDAGRELACIVDFTRKTRL